MLITYTAIFISIVALYKAFKAHQLANKAITRDLKINLVRGFIERLSLEQLKRLEMSFRFKAETYRIDNILAGDFKLISDYDILLEAIQDINLKDYYIVIAQEINKKELAMKNQNK
ncbi:hypothetical protein AVU07_agp101 [Escherichia phage phiSUSP1]|uniref:Uncharacterized protein n=1 Tax=Escherichia phage phiSUSP1 TaxID=1718606 RepID=A0A0N9SU35_9CAUD|nr:hypothetical protein AVU07_agp101 [Escherichia phage phiSUSP1]ALH46992.1 hypothetical protein [Escherichia phage phiSUSP1]EFG4626562.1 hypothetical protein [Escherichia coli]